MPAGLDVVVPAHAPDVLNDAIPNGHDAVAVRRRLHRADDLHGVGRRVADGHARFKGVRANECPNRLADKLLVPGFDLRCASHQRDEGQDGKAWRFHSGLRSWLAATHRAWSGGRPLPLQALAGFAAKFNVQHTLSHLSICFLNRLLCGGR